MTVCPGVVGLDCDLEPLCSLLVRQMRPVGAEDLTNSLFLFIVLDVGFCHAGSSLLRLGFL